MNNFTIFIVGLVVTLIAGMGVITSTVFVGYSSSGSTEDKYKEINENISTITHTSTSNRS
jgi:hypothetical protein